MPKFPTKEKIVSKVLQYLKDHTTAKDTHISDRLAGSDGYITISLTKSNQSLLTFTDDCSNEDKPLIGVELVGRFEIEAMKNTIVAATELVIVDEKATEYESYELPVYYLWLGENNV